jgi:hypothetical protein
VYIYPITSQHCFPTFGGGLIYVALQAAELVVPQFQSRILFSPLGYLDQPKIIRSMIDLSPEPSPGRCCGRAECLGCGFFNWPVDYRIEPMERAMGNGGIDRVIEMWIERVVVGRVKGRGADSA